MLYDRGCSPFLYLSTPVLQNWVLCAALAKSAQAPFNSNLVLLCGMHCSTFCSFVCTGRAAIHSSLLVLGADSVPFWLGSAGWPGTWGSCTAADCRRAHLLGVLLRDAHSLESWIVQLTGFWQALAAAVWLAPCRQLSNSFFLLA